MRALVRMHGDSAPPGLLAEWMGARGIAFDVHRGYEPGPAPSLDGYDFVASLGFRHSPRDRHEPAVAAELALLGEAVERDVPVLGLCFGGQALAAALGARVERAPAPELGWIEIDSDDPEQIPRGPWLAWHYDRFETPAGAVELARTPVAVQAFRHGRHLGLQFHPETTPEIVASWARTDAERELLERQVLPAATAEARIAARAAAFALFDGFLATANDPAAAAAGARRG